jgi:hypothetical protein
MNPNSSFKVALLFLHASSNIRLRHPGEQLKIDPVVGIFERINWIESIFSIDETPNIEQQLSAASAGAAEAALTQLWLTSRCGAKHYQNGGNHERMAKSTNQSGI